MSTVQQETTTSLPHITEVKPLGEEDKNLIADVVEVLEKHEALGRFGLTLLHQHFPIGKGEIQLEETEVGSRTQTIKMVKQEEVEKLPHIETSWRLDTGKAVAQCACFNYGAGHQHLSN